MSRCRITVIKRSLNPELAEEFIKSKVGLCEIFKEGQTFETQFSQKPEGFCDWAWNDIYKTVVTLAHGGNFSKDLFASWMNDDNSMITCCTDGIRPVIFKVERIED